MKSQDKLYSFLGDRIGNFFLGFHNCVMKERLVDFNFYKQFLTRQVNEQFHSHSNLKIFVSANGLSK